MKYLPGQVKSIIDIPEETFRHWRKVLTPLIGRKGKSAQFVVGEILALLIIKQITQNIGVNISSLNSISTELFKKCISNSFIQLQRSHLYINFEIKSVTLRSNRDPHIHGNLLLEIDCAPLIELIRSKLFESTELQVQQELTFPPFKVGEN